ncbi:hypothetical protein ABZV14_32265 [Streptosporangium canum]|uniref:hypothetical protein n=1 Tax=Streptosporangium canum TaxID=324952 RepID=UPI0033A97EB6
MPAGEEWNCFEMAKRPETSGVTTVVRPENEMRADVITRNVVNAPPGAKAAVTSW